MSSQKLLRTIKYFSLFALLLSTTLAVLMWFAPSMTVRYAASGYILAFLASSAMLLLAAIAAAILRKTLRVLLTATGWLLLNVVVGVVYFQIFRYCMDTMVVNITNNTGHEVTEVRCFDDNGLGC